MRYYKIKLILIISSVLAFGCLGFSVIAGNPENNQIVGVSAPANKYYSINIDRPTIAKGYTVAAFDNNLKLSLVPGILEDATRVQIVELHEPLPVPWNIDLASNVYQFEFENKSAYDNHKPFYIQFSYNKKSNSLKQAFFYDKNYNKWRPLPTNDFPEKGFVRSLIHLPFARIAVFEYPDILSSGRASWYAYKGGNYAASPDFPKGSRLRVYNKANNKFVDVEINDYGPNRSLFPDRAIDLDKIAFKKLAGLGAGMIDVFIKPLYIAPVDNKILGIRPEGAGQEPDTNFKSFIVYSENDGKIILEKNATATLPLASLTKLVAIKIFLNTKPTLNREVAYSVADEEHNYEFCNPWESARLRVSDGDILTVEDLIYASLVGSANNAVETLVRASGLKRSDFIKNMNSLVLRWGASSTHFIEPTGLSPQNVSSARDYAIITREVFKHPIIQKASIAKEYVFTTINTKKTHKLKNTDRLIKTNKYNIIGSKTGYLDEAGYCLMARIGKGAKNLIVVTFGAPDRDTSFAETEELIKYGIKFL